MAPPSGNLYDILRVRRTSSFETIKRAYYRRAKECHPDRFGGNAAKEEEFKRVVSAFDILSNAQARKAYDEQLAVLDAPPEPARFRETGPAIMDSIADDILEEMIVGNEIPRNTTLQMLMRDLTRTRRFVMFREARYRYAQSEYLTALHICRKLVTWSPMNILYHYYYAEAAARLSKFWRARKHYRICLQLGLMRVPPQRLDLIRRHLNQLTREQGMWGKLLSWFATDLPPSSISVREDMSGRLDRAFDKAYGKMLERDRRRQRIRGRRPKKKHFLEQ